MDKLQQQIFNNFRNDIMEYIKQKLTPQYLADTHNIHGSSGLPTEDISFEKLLGIYYLFRHRFPQGFKEVLWSREILQNPLFHKYRKNINEIAAIINTGRSLREYLPDDIGNLRRCTFMDTKADHLLTGWGITHLHLFTHAERQKLHQANKNDDKFLLYVISAKDKIFFIDIQDHCSMTDTNLLDIKNSNITGNALSGFIKNNCSLTPQHLSRTDISKLRKLGIGFALGLNNKGDIFMSDTLKPAWWYACAHINEQLNTLAGWCATNYTSLLQDIHAIIPEYTPSNTMDIHLGFGERKQLYNRQLDDVFIYIKYNETSGGVLDIPDNQPIKIVSNILKQHDII